MHFIIRGMIIGFSIAAPVGAIGIHCIRKTIQFGRLSGLSSGLGAAAANLTYGIIGVFGLTSISKVLLAEQFWIRLIGGLFLMFLGAKTYIYKTKIEIEKKSNHTTLIKDFFITFILALTNPVTILAFLAIFAGLGVPKGEVNSILLVSGVFIGSALWWLLLCEFVTIFRKKIEEKMMVWLNRGAGLIIFGFGVTALILAFYEKRLF